MWTRPLPRSLVTRQERGVIDVPSLDRADTRRPRSTPSVSQPHGHKRQVRDRFRAPPLDRVARVLQPAVHRDALDLLPSMRLPRTFGLGSSGATPRPPLLRHAVRPQLPLCQTQPTLEQQRPSHLQSCAILRDHTMRTLDNATRNAARMLPSTTAGANVPALVSTPHHRGGTRMVTVRPDVDLGTRWSGTKTKRNASCLWKAVCLRKADSKMGAASVAHITDVLQEHAFEEGTAGWMPPQRSLTLEAEESVDMGCLMYEKQGLQRALDHPHSKVAWASDSTPGLGRELQAPPPHPCS